MLSFLGQKFKRSNRASENPLITDGGASATRFLIPKSPEEGFLMETIFFHDKWTKLKEGGKGATTLPPYHFHWVQEEIFIVEKGAFIFEVEGKTIRVTPADGETSVPGGDYHLFYPDTSTGEDTVMKTWALPDYGADECFFRNLFSYLEDCKAHNIKPSLFQLLLFLHEHDISLAIPSLPKSIGKFVGKWVMGYFGGKIIGQMVLGYKPSYEEYYAGETIKKDQ